MRKSKERIGSPTTKSLVSYERRNAYPPAPANSSNLRQGRPGIAVGLEERPRREPQMAEADHQTATENSPRRRRRWGWWRPGLSGGVWKGLETRTQACGQSGNLTTFFVELSTGRKFFILPVY